MWKRTISNWGNGVPSSQGPISLHSSLDSAVTPGELALISATATRTEPSPCEPSTGLSVVTDLISALQHALKYLNNFIFAYCLIML